MTTYKPHYACFVCRKTFKRRLFKDIKVGKQSDLEVKCPDCESFMANMGFDFESPKKNDVKKWEHIKSLYSVGIAFHSCGCSGPGYIPNSKEKLQEYFEDLKVEYLNNMDFWRTRTEPINNRERDSDWGKNWVELGSVSRKHTKEIIKNQEGIDFWMEKVKEIQSKINLVK
jgi:DNA-directed RNA polymerase subunit RPC12/RpoP